MLKDQFNELFDKTHSECSRIMTSKRADYANEDVLSNFKRLSEVARLLGVEPSRSAWDYAMFMVVMKIDRWCNLRRKKAKPTNESVQDTVIDAHNYIDLAYANEVEETES